MRVRSSEAKGADAGNRAPAIFRQRFEGNLNSKRQGIECDVGIRLREMQCRGDRPVVKCERRLDQPSDPGRRFEVTDIGLDRAHGTFRSGVAPLGKDGPERGQLDRIAKLRPGTVTFNEVHLTRRDARSCVRVAEDCLLRSSVGSRQAVAASILVDCSTPDHRVDPVAVGQGAGERFEYHHPCALAADIAIGLGVESLAPAFGR